jgi:hypothetical protein
VHAAPRVIVHVLVIKFVVLFVIAQRPHRPSSRFFSRFDYLSHFGYSSDLSSLGYLNYFGYIRYFSYPGDLRGFAGTIADELCRLLRLIV